MTVEDAVAIREKVKSVDLVGAELWRFGAQAGYKGEKTEPNLWVVGGDGQYAPNNTHLVGLGRNLTDEDVRVLRRVAVIGYAVADRSFRSSTRSARRSRSTATSTRSSASSRRRSRPPAGTSTTTS